MKNKIIVLIFFFGFLSIASLANAKPISDPSWDDCRQNGVVLCDYALPWCAGFNCPDGYNCIGGQCVIPAPACRTGTRPNWQCSGWSPCSFGQQTRTCRDLNQCTGNIVPPITTQNCVNCIPDCGSAKCGMDPKCGKKQCGPGCKTGQVCNNGQCCNKNCGPDSCGKSDGCGGICENCLGDGAKCIQKPTNAAEKFCCTPNCRKDECSDDTSDGCGGTCPQKKRVDITLGAASIVIDPIYVSKTKSERFFVPTIEELNPYDDIDCVLTNVPKGEEEFIGELYLDPMDGSVSKKLLTSGTLRYDEEMGVYAWKIKGGQGGWGKELIDPVDIYMKTKINSTNRDIKCVIRKKCPQEQQKKIETRLYHVGLCVHVWGGDKSPTSSVDGTQGRLTGGGRSIAARVYKFATMKKSDVTAEMNPYDFAEFIRKNALNLFEPFSKYPYQFEYYASLVNKNIATYNLKLEDTECEDLDLLYYNTNDRGAAYYNHIININPASSKKAETVLHETGHYFKLEDEYVYKNKPADLIARWIASGTNCDPDNTCINIKAKAGIFYTDSCYKGCIGLSGYRTTINSMMHFEGPSVLFNEVSCAVIVQNIEQMYDSSKAWEKCALMNNLEKTEQCAENWQCSIPSSPLPVTCQGDCDFVSYGCGTCDQTTKMCIKEGDFLVAGGKSCTAKLLLLDMNKTYSGKCEGSKPPYICNAQFR